MVTINENENLVELTITEGLREIAVHYGFAHQRGKLSEEMGELNDALLDGDNAGIAEEIADVLNVIEEIRYLRGIPIKEIKGIQLEKIQRQHRRIASSNEEGL